MDGAVEKNLARVGGRKKLEQRENNWCGRKEKKEISVSPPKPYPPSLLPAFSRDPLASPARRRLCASPARSDAVSLAPSHSRAPFTPAPRLPRTATSPTHHLTATSPTPPSPPAPRTAALQTPHSAMPLAPHTATPAALRLCNRVAASLADLQSGRHISTA